MSAVAWIEEQAPGFGALSTHERNAITDFAFLWSFFESKVLGRNGNANAIIEAAKRWDAAGLIDDGSFGEAAAYFRDRYYRDGEFTCHFGHLNLRRPDKPELVEKFLKGECGQAWEVPAAVLIIVYRFRNNLFHGEKWAYNLQGQQDNFEHANKVLIHAVELDRRVQERQR